MSLVNRQRTISLMKRQTLILLIILTVLNEKCTSTSDDFELTILHTNDLHSKYEETEINGRVIGGLARVATFIRRERAAAAALNKSVIYLNAGDMFTGSIWFIVHTTNITSDVTKLLNPDASCVGNHEFDLGVRALREYITMIGRPLLCCNCDVSREPLLAGKIVPSDILVVKDRKIGIIGYINNNVRTLDKYYGKVTIEDATDSIRAEVAKLKKKGVNIIIALSHAGYQTDQLIMKVIDDVDLVVGGHSHLFLYTGNIGNMTIDEPSGAYPTIVRNRKNKIVYVVQAGANCKYVGKLTVIFDKNGEVNRIWGNPHLMDASITKDKAVMDLLKQYRPKVDLLRNTIVGTTYTNLIGHRDCRGYECNMGNLIADAFTYFQAKISGDSKRWSDVGAAFITSGTIEDSVPITTGGMSNITYADMLTILPYDDYVCTIRINGSVLKAVLEHSISWSRYSHKGEFLQYSGLRVFYNFQQPTGKRLINAVIRCGNCQIPKYEPIKDSKMYDILTVEYVASGGSGYRMLEGSQKPSSEPWDKAIDVVTYYTSMQPFLSPDIEGRILVLNDMRLRKEETNACDRISVDLLLLYVIYFLIIVDRNF